MMHTISRRIYEVWRQISHKGNSGHLPVSALCGILAMGFMPTGCGPGAVPENQTQSTAFRVRSVFEQALNEDEGWAGRINEPVSISADQPFRIRFEVEAASGFKGDSFHLQARRNAGPWTNVEAHDFPYPAREIDLEFETAVGNEAPIGWSVSQDGTSSLKVATVDGTQTLQAHADQEPLITVYSPPWEVTELAVELRMAEGSRVGAGCVFAYVDSDNYCGVFLDSENQVIRVIRVAAGIETTITTQPASVSAGQWYSLEIDMENELAQINFEDDSLEFEADMGTGTPSSQIGFYVSAGGQAEFRNTAIAGEASSPRVSIVSCPGFADGEATTDLLQGSTAPFHPGAGIDRAEKTPRWNGTGHSEFEWALVVRRFADRALTNEAGDRFEFRMVTSDGKPAHSGPNPILELTIPSGHLGGTYVEAPGRIGPFSASNGDLYFIMEPSETDNLFMMVKSNDHGQTWREVDAAHRPKTNDLEAVDVRQVGDTLYALHQVTESAHLHAFRTSDHPDYPDTWAFTDELVAEADSMAQAATLATRSDGSMVAFYVGQTLHYNIRSPGGSWGRQRIVDPDQVAAAGPHAVTGANDTVHVAYYRTDGTIWYRRLLSDGVLTQAQLLASGVESSRAVYGAALPLVYLPETNNVVIVYRLADGYLWERRIDLSGTMTDPIRVSDRQVVTDAVDSQQAGADVIADGQSLHVLFIDEASRSIFSTHDRGGWQPAILQVDNILGSWVRGNTLLRQDGSRTYGFVYDAGSYGGAGMNRYGEIELGDR